MIIAKNNAISNDNVILFQYREEKSNNMVNYHFHRYYEMYCLIRGKRTLFVDNQIITLTPGSIAIISPTTLHKYTNTDSSEEYSSLLIYFNMNAFFPSMLKDGKLNSVLQQKYYIADLPYNIFDEIINTICGELERSQPAMELNLHASFFKLFSEILRHNCSPDVSAQNALNANDLVKLITIYIDRNLDKELSLELLASKFFVNPSYLSRKFKKETNMNLNKYITEKRIQRSIQIMITEHALPMARVARNSGFSSTATFYRAFKSIMNCAPYQFKNKIHELKM